MFSSPAVQEQLVTITQVGKLAGALVINDYGLANKLAQAGCKYVVHRNTDGENSYEPLDGTPGDIDRGRGMWEKLGRTQAANLDPRVYIMIGNESNAPQDGYYWLGQMQAADAEGRKLAIFANSVGHPNAWSTDPNNEYFTFNKLGGNAHRTIGGASAPGSEAVSGIDRSWRVGYNEG